MPLQISDLGKERRTFTWEYLDQEIEITYNVYQFTPEMEAEINAGGHTDERMSQILVENLLAILIDWDVLDGEDKIPLEYDRLMELPTRLMADLMQAIGQDAGGDEEEGKSSGGRSSQNRASRRARRSGTISSVRQGSFESRPGT
jgi:hypothetical protein